MARITFEIDDDLFVTLKEYASFLGVSVETILNDAVEFEASILSKGISLISSSLDNSSSD